MKNIVRLPHPGLPLLLVLLPLSGFGSLLLLQPVFGFCCWINVFQLQVQRHISPQSGELKRWKSNTQRVCFWVKDFVSWFYVPWYARLLWNQFHFSPSGLVVVLVFQLSDFLLNDTHPLSVYEHCVLLETHTKHIHSCITVFSYCKTIFFSSYSPVQWLPAFCFGSTNKLLLIC